MDSTNLGYSYHLPNGGLMLKVRNALSQFSDLFSEFNKYIAPAYHHDRCERSVQMRLYSMHKREFVMVFLCFYICFGLGVFIGLAGPPITVTSSFKGTSILKEQNTSIGDIWHGPFKIKSPTMSTYHQQLWVLAQIRTDNKDDDILDRAFHVSVAISALTSDHKEVRILRADQAHNRTHHLRCDSQICNPVTILHLGFLDYTHYILDVNFNGLENFHKHYTVKQVTFFFKSYNPGFTQIEIWFRFIFLLSTFIITCWFAHTLRKFPIFDWSIEQKWMSCMLPLLLLYNNPIFPLTFLVNSWIPSMLDAVFQATFLCGLLLFWICIYHGLRQTERRILTFYIPKLLIVGPLWLTAVIMATWQKANELQDPTYSYKIDTSNFYNFKIIFFVFISMYIIYLLCLILRAYSELRSMPFFDMRLKFLTLLMLIVITISITITVMRFGIGVLEDNFVSELSTTYNSSAQFMSFYGLLNFYMYTMAYVYSPSKKTVFDTSITKDNPAFSMINDSDEDVIYGSDEESRQPLNRSHNEDDSD
ncbi:transmembrane protein 181 isoform X1 [Cimex lectularius]|uniref:Transmembrane protein 181 n=1 Tax=Cimex lectularius TaxID=79782 RepID=A0A8I6SDS2_CIMLE|nr:transmembrane protein 181 isoform X1 [Cimex lectularius]